MILRNPHYPSSAVLRSVALLTALVAVAVLAGAAPAPSVPDLTYTTRSGADAEVSSNWAGYAISGTGVSGAPIAFNDVTASWTVPTAVCAPGQRTFSAFWVGLGGFSDESQALEQTGSETNCTGSGTPQYGLWYEIVPAPAVRINLKVAPGDRITAAVLVVDTQVILQITNTTRHVRFTKRSTVAAPDLSSAEWIAEAPSTCGRAGDCRTLPLTNFGAVSFTRAAATGDRHAGTIVDPAWSPTAIQLAESGAGGFDPRFLPAPVTPTSGATPGPLSPDGRGFTVSWQANVAR